MICREAVMLAAGCLLPSLLAGVLAPAAMDCHCVEQLRFSPSVGESWISPGLSENGGNFSCRWH